MRTHVFALVNVITIRFISFRVKVVRPSFLAISISLSPNPTRSRQTGASRVPIFRRRRVERNAALIRASHPWTPRESRMICPHLSLYVTVAMSVKLCRYPAVRHSFTTGMEENVNTQPVAVSQMFWSNSSLISSFYNLHFSSWVFGFGKG